MADPSDGIPNNITASFAELKEAATQLNAVSDTLASPIEWLDGAIKRLNLGIPAWKECKREINPETDDYWTLEIGYAKINSKWGVALRTTSGNPAAELLEDTEAWLFNDAPRHLRVLAVDHLPLVIEALIAEARGTADRIMQKIGQAEQFARAVSAATLKQGGPPPVRRK